MKKWKIFILIPLFLMSGCAGFAGNSSQGSDDQEYILLKVNNYSGLLKLYRDRLQNKEEPKTRYKVAEYYYLLDDFESSRHFLAPLLVSHPSAEYSILESKNLLDLGQKEEALAAIDKAISLEPDNGDAHNIRGVILAESGYFDESINAFNQSREKLLADSIVMNNIAMVYILKEDYAKALDYLMPMYLRGDKSPKLIYNLVLSLIKTHDYLRAENVIRDENIPQTLEQLMTALGDVQVAIKETAYTPKTAEKKIDDAQSNSLKNPKSNNSVSTANSLFAINSASTDSVIKDGIIKDSVIPVSTDVSGSVAPSLNQAEKIDTVAPANTMSALPSSPPVAKTKNDVTNLIVPDSLMTTETPNINQDSNKKAASIVPAANQPTAKEKQSDSSSQKAIISDVRMADNAKGTRLVIESDKEIKFNVLKSENANQLVVELINFNESKLLTNSSRYLKKKHKTIESIMFNSLGENNVKMIFQFKRSINTKVYRMGPEDHYKDRVVIDFID